MQRAYAQRGINLLSVDYRGVAGDVTYFLVEHLLLQRGRMASAALSDF